MEKKEFQNVIFRKASPLDAPSLPIMRQVNYEGLKPGKTTLKKGTVFIEGAIPLPCDIIWERDIGVKLRDGITIYIDIFRPSSNSKVPAILSWSPYGKHVPQEPPPGVLKEHVSGLQKFEGPDPAYWCNHGYAIINVDTRGAFSSEGDIHFWGKMDALDGRDVIEWVALQEWCNGRVGMSGNSWLAIAQWFIAAENPPHLCAIAPWEGLSDLYREDVLRGGIPNIGFNEIMIKSLRGKNYVEDIPAMVQKYPFINDYWEDKIACIEKIKVPAYVVASWTNDLHTFGTLEAFRRVSSGEKWLRVHNTHEWSDYYTPENVEDLRRFFDRYLKGENNGWENTPKVRLSILDPGGKDIVNRIENEWPLSRTKYQKLYLDASKGTMSLSPVNQESSIRYRADDNQGQASFTFHFEKDTELTGYFKLHLWVESDGSQDMDIFVLLQKLDKNNNPQIIKKGMVNYYGPNGRLRVSHRELDPKRSHPWLPYHTHREEKLLKPKEIVSCDIMIWPSGMIWHKDEKLQLIIGGFNPVPFHLPGIPGPITRNKGYHIIHTGGRFDSYLLIPVV